MCVIWGVKIVKLQKTKRGTYIISLPKKYVIAQGWQDGEELAICPHERQLRLIPLSKGG